jgi:hypothetical protein
VASIFQLHKIVIGIMTSPTRTNKWQKNNEAKLLKFLKNDIKPNNQKDSNRSRKP